MGPRLTAPEKLDLYNASRQGNAGGFQPEDFTPNVNGDRLQGRRAVPCASRWENMGGSAQCVVRRGLRALPV
jgi:hypothetical protein